MIKLALEDAWPTQYAISSLAVSGGTIRSTAVAEGERSAEASVRETAAGTFFLCRNAVGSRGIRNVPFGTFLPETP